LPKALIFSPLCLEPARSGGQRGNLSFAESLLRQGWEVILAGAELGSDGRWSDSSNAAIESRLGLRVAWIERPRWKRLFSMLAFRTIPAFRFGRSYSDGRRCPLDLRRAFARLAEKERPDLVLVNNAAFDGLASGCVRSVPRILVAHDLVSVNRAQRERLDRYRDGDGFLPEALQEDFFLSQEFLPDHLEIEAVGRWPVSVVVSRSERESLSEMTTSGASIHWIPVTRSIPASSSSLDGPAIFPTGPNPFNLQAGWYLVHRVLPQAVAAEPGFRLMVTGDCSDLLPDASGLDRVGTLPDVASIYSRARFLACPVFGGTGQQVKVIEAMAWGVPPVLLKAGLRDTPVLHGRNGLVAQDATEFVEYCLALWRDPDLRSRLGKEARETIRREFGTDRIDADLADAIRCARERVLG